MTDHAVSWHSGKWSSWNGTLALCCLDGCSFWKEIPKIIIIDIAAAADTVREVAENAQSTFTFIFISNILFTQYISLALMEKTWCLRAAKIIPLNSH